jgi:DNA-binding NtrC family response regulator
MNVGARRPTVLIVDDAEAVCLTLSIMLEKHGFLTQTARNVEETIRSTAERNFDLIVVDRNLGTESGLGLAEQLLLKNPAQRIVIISGSVTIKEELESHPALHDLPVLQKPFTRQEFLECLRSTMHEAA